ncbi:MAG: hypothetical protein ICV51_20625, partial [Flavisolibacter sp.]|nr:hypothetical protein [Flavisolibacter sp.]
MQFKQTFVRLFFLFVPYTVMAQTTFFPQGARENHLADRLEIKSRIDSILNFSKIKPYSRKAVIPILQQYRNSAALVQSAGEIPITEDAAQQRINETGARLTKVDLYNANIALMNSLEWTDSSYNITSRKPMGRFYKTPATLFEVKTPDFFLAVNPVFHYIIAKEKNNSQHLFLNTRGVSLRGRIMNKIGFAAYLTDNQERDPLYVQEWVRERLAVPGTGFYQQFKTTGYDYFDARGYISFNAAKVVDITFGYDRNFIGNGYRSLFLSDFTNSYLFLKLNTRIWKLNYQNLFMELHTTRRTPADVYIPKKYAALHHLDVAFTKWLNIGVFEGVIFGRKDHFDFGYLNPVIFYRSIEQQNGSFDNSIAGIDAKANVANHFQLYSQFLLDEFKLAEIRRNRGWWANKWGLQFGAKYIDAFGIPNLDVQVETNRVRPFTYSHRDSVANYTHYNQPLAHPLGANFNEWIGIARYQPAPKWLLQVKGIYYKQGKDIGNVSYGSNILLPNIGPYRTKEYGYEIGAGVP